MIRFRRLLVPHDFSRQADRALKVAADLAGPTGKLLVLHAVMPIVATTDPVVAAGIYVPIPLDELIASARRHLERVVDRVVGRRGPKTVSKVEAGDPCGRIVANTRGMDAIVMSTLGRTGLSHMVIGSVAEKTVRHSPIPVLTLRSAAARAASGRRIAPTRRRAPRRR